MIQLPKIVTAETKRDNMVALRLTAEEKNKLISVSKALNLSYTDLFVYCLEFLDSLTAKALKDHEQK